MPTTPQTPFLNLVSTNLGSLNSWTPNFNTSGLAGSPTTLGESARALCFFFDSDAIQSFMIKILHISYSITYRGLFGSINSNSRVFGRIAVIRNFKGDLSKITFDPFLTDNTPNVNIPASNGNNWGFPRFNWDAAEFLFNHFPVATLSSGGIEKFNIILPQLHSEENILIVMTPVYGDGAARPQPINNDPAQGWNVGEFLGSDIQSNNFVSYRSLTVQAEFC